MGLPIAYTFSPKLDDLTKRIDQFRRHILTQPLLPRKEIELRYEASLGRVLASLQAAHIPMTSSELNRLLTHMPKKAHPMEREALLYRQALTYIRSEWSGAPKSLSLVSFEVLMHIAFSLQYSSISRSMHTSESDLKRLVMYIEETQSSDHPVLIAGVTHAVMAHTELQERSRGRMALLAGSLILTKYGYDCRGMLNLEHALTRDPNAYALALQSTLTLGQMTVWLEFYASCAMDAFASLLQDIDVTTRHPLTHSQSFPSLNERQKHILMLLEAPSAKVTNREIQKRFRISQITASRDLTKLVSYGFLLTSGRGRSVYYTLA